MCTNQSNMIQREGFGFLLSGLSPAKRAYNNCSVKYLMLIVQRVKPICSSTGACGLRGRAAWEGPCEGRFLAEAGGGRRLKVMGGRKAVASATGKLLWGCWVR